MIRILGNSPERVPIEDLDDIVYYKQIKDYTDQEYEKSKDLKRAIDKGQLALLEQNKSPRGSVETDGNRISNQAPSLSIRDLKTALKEVFPEIKNNNVSEDAVKGAVREIAPLIVSMVREEVSKISISSAPVAAKKETSKFMGPQYIPDVDTDGMVDNIEAKKRVSSSNDVDDNLAALRALKKNK